jgi:hypothetical protein
MLHRSVILRAETRLGVFETRVLRRIFECKREEIAGGWRKLYKEVFHNFYFLPHIVWVIKSR